MLWEAVALEQALLGTTTTTHSTVSPWEGGWEQVCFISSIIMWLCKAACEYEAPCSTSGVRMELVLSNVFP